MAFSASYYDKFNNGSERALEERLFPLHHQHNRRYQFNNNNNSANGGSNHGTNGNNGGGCGNNYRWSPFCCYRSSGNYTVNGKRVCKRVDLMWILALFGLLLLSLLVWVFHSASGDTSAHRNASASSSADCHKTTKVMKRFYNETIVQLDEEIDFLNLNATTPQPTIHQSPSLDSTNSSTPENDDGNNNNNSNNNNSNNNEDVASVRPLKQGPRPLHNHDIIYDEMRNASAAAGSNSTGGGGGATSELHSGHFRYQGAEVWDPHPEYLIEAFGRKFLLVLRHDINFSPPNLRVVHVWSNYSERVNVTDYRGCYYTGHVQGDKHSYVAVSLCNGMTGYIKTGTADYYIHPKEQYWSHEPHWSPLHEMQRLRDDFLNFDEDLPTNHHHHHNRDDTPIRVDASHHQSRERRRMRRQVDYDYDDEVYRDELIYNNNNNNINNGHSPSPNHGVQHQPHQSSTNGGGSARDQHYVLQQHQHQTIEAITKPYFIATMVVADRKMALYHKTEEILRHYILTLMAHVALLYKDATIGNPITLAVIDIVILEDVEFTSTTSQEILRKFCEFQHMHSRKAHDVALLLTRDVICKNASVQYCTTLGVAEVGSMCTPSSSCAIVRDKGLSTSYTIAHELGHVLSMPHDDDRKCAPFHAGTKATNIMSKMLHNDTKPWYWSACSKHFLNEFLNSPRSRCLLDEPRLDMIGSGNFRNHDMLPGEMFAVNRQCELEFGTGSQICSFMPYCGSLWCTNEAGEAGGCKTQYMPWADGTECGKDSWCHHGKCIAKNKLSMVAGGWGSWQEWGECSRTCGGGITVSIRECNNPAPANGGPYCIGGSKRYQSCNTHQCDGIALDFRESQCARFNGQTKGIPNLAKSVVWVPKYGTTNPDDYCKLYCRVKDSSAYYMLSEKVYDGTKCGLNSFDICVNGMCQKGGCDNKLGSNVTLDECGVCGGVNSTCQVVSGYFNGSTYGYSRVTVIPKGSSNIRITQTSSSSLLSPSDDNYLALKDVGPPAARYLLNGNSIISGYMKDIVYGGLTFKYSGSNRSVEEITSPRKAKLLKDLVVEVLCVGTMRPPNIHFSYTIGIGEAPQFGVVVYEDQWTACDAICDGEQRTVTRCHDLARNEPVEPSKCAGDSLMAAAAARTTKCNTHCYLQWAVKSRDHCSSHCGPGFQRVHHNCVKVTGQQREVIDERHCSALSRPETEESCVGACEIRTHWEYGAWSQCSKTCGGGVQQRAATCVNYDEEPIDSQHCHSYPKHDQQTCNIIKCPSWSYDNWAPCSVTCGTGFRTRPHYCQMDNVVYDSAHCDPSALQVVKESCNAGACLMKGYWREGKWSDCSATCGEGVRRREVKCVGRPVCDPTTKPLEEQACSGQMCSYEDNSVIVLQQNAWVAESWGECLCKQGYRRSKVYCRDQFGATLPDRSCDPLTRPKAKAPCKCHRNGNTNINSNNNLNVNSNNNLNVNSNHDLNVNSHDNFNANSNNNLNVNSNNNLNVNSNHNLNVNSHDNFNANSNNNLNVNSNKNLNVNSNKNINRNLNVNDKNVNSNNMAESSFLMNANLTWTMGKWSGCSTHCGKGKQTRSVSCYANGTIKVVEPLCEKQLRRPKSWRACEKYRCAHAWVEGDWSNCSQTCGRGFKTRSVTCHKVLPDGFLDQSVLPHSNRNGYCNRYDKPPARAECVDAHCGDKVAWSRGAWGKCSHPCGKRGRQIRRVACVDVRSGREVARHLCRKGLKPRRKQKCNHKRCICTSCKHVQRLLRTRDNNDYMLWLEEPQHGGRGRFARVYCYKMDTDEPEEFISLRPGTINYAEYYAKRLRRAAADTCPNEVAGDDCDCDTLPRNAGKTVFWKIRLNITSMRVNENDFTFSQQQDGVKIPYGYAGDCYSQVPNCIRGSFQVDLTDTSFRLARDVQWTFEGNNASMDIRMNDVKVIGKCGGSCGSCSPDPQVGLKVEVT